jgi:ribokinase
MSEQRPKVVVIGGAYVDMAVRCTHIPSAGQSVFGSALCHTITGPGPNQAVQAVHCGCEVVLIAKVGGDPFGPVVKQNLDELGVQTHHIYTAEAMNTGAVVTLVNAKGENASCYYPGANSALQPRDIQIAEQEISEAAVCLLHGRLPQETITEAIRCAEIHGTKVILNPARPLEQADQTAADVPVEYFSAHILIPNLYEAADIAEKSSAGIRTAKLIGSDLVARGVHYAVITMGRRGCMLVDRHNAVHVPAFNVDLVDHTGRGDAFAGALAAFCAVEDNMAEAVQFASAAGALACTKFGSIESMPTKAEIIQLLQKEDTF